MIDQLIIEIYLTLRPSEKNKDNNHLYKFQNLRLSKLNGYKRKIVVTIKDIFFIKIGMFRTVHIRKIGLGHPRANKRPLQVHTTFVFCFTTY